MIVIDSCVSLGGLKTETLIKGAPWLVVEIGPLLLISTITQWYDNHISTNSSVVRDSIFWISNPEALRFPVTTLNFSVFLWQESRLTPVHDWWRTYHTSCLFFFKIMLLFILWTFSHIYLFFVIFIHNYLPPIPPGVLYLISLPPSCFPIVDIIPYLDLVLLVLLMFGKVWDYLLWHEKPTCRLISKGKWPSLNNQQLPISPLIDVKPQGPSLCVLKFWLAWSYESPM